MLFRSSRAWHLPVLLTTLMGGDSAHLPRVQNVQLAVKLARHSTDGWNNPAIPDDLTAIQSLLHISRDTLLDRLQLPPEVLPRFLLAGGEREDHQTNGHDFSRHPR